MPEELLRKTFEIQGWDFENAGERSTEVTTILKDLDVDPNIILRVGVVAFEAEMNVVMYAGRATLTLVVTDDEIAGGSGRRGTRDPRHRVGDAARLLDGFRRDARDGIRLRPGASEYQEELRRLLAAIRGWERSRGFTITRPWILVSLLLRRSGSIEIEHESFGELAFSGNM